jgi:hypothetical protein
MESRRNFQVRCCATTQGARIVAVDTFLAKAADGAHGGSAACGAFRWPLTVKAYGPNQLFIPRMDNGQGPSEIEYVRRWAKARAQWMDKYIVNFVGRPGMVRPRAARRLTTT